MHLAKNWWVFLIRGILALLFGAVAMFFPASAFVSLVLVFGAFALIDGIFAIVSAFTSNANSENWWWIVTGGLLGVAVGALTLILPEAATEAWIYLIAAWAVIGGIFEIVTAIRIRKMIEGEFWMILSGAISVVFGVLIAMNPFSGAVAIGVLIGIYAILGGIMMIALALRLRKFGGPAAAEA